MPRVIPYIESIQYDGTNARYICGTWADVELASEDEAGMVVNFVGDVVIPTLIPPGFWLVKSHPFPAEFAIKSPAQYAAQYVELTPEAVTP
ncbi:hypothetical protein ACH40E_02835 [Streptomyces acidicola]|uniref:hypothetical protein n=1 Tax=Streptomyces acidicola TaxID=2596892 RepID=UPI0037983A5F